MKIAKSMNFIIDYVIYPFDCMFSFGESDEDLYKLLKKKGINDPEEIHIHGNARCVMFSGGQTVVRLKVIPKHPHEFGWLQHEIFHAVEFLLNRIGISLCRESDEAYSYLIEYLTTQVYKMIKVK